MLLDDQIPADNSGNNMGKILEVPIEDGEPIWAGGTPEEQGFENISLPHLQRSNSNMKEYHIYKDETEFVVIEANSAIDAINESKIEMPFKVIHANCRLNRVVNDGELQLAPEPVLEEKTVQEAVIEDNAAIDSAEQPAEESGAEAAAEEVVQEESQEAQEPAAQEQEVSPPTDEEAKVDQPESS
ncbi:hypothetical protein N9W34_02550 [Rickettsiales bacterium]|nr:hypothetical protein [Rickettsiales bacterium]